MELKFVCAECKTTFNAKGIRKEWTDRTYGPCWKYVATSPCCKVESDEYREPKIAKNNKPTIPESCQGCSNKQCGMNF